MKKLVLMSLLVVSTIAVLSSCKNEESENTTTNATSNVSTENVGSTKDSTATVNVDSVEKK